MKQSGGFHEDLSRHYQATGSSDRAFGFVFSLFFAAVALWPLGQGRPVRWWWAAAAGAVLAVAVLRPALLAPANRLWMRFGLLLGRIVTPLVTALIFFGVVTPIGALMRMFGKDPLRRGFEPGAATYWQARDANSPAPESMRHQF